MTVELVHVSAQDRIIAAPLRSHSTMVVHVRRWMVLHVFWFFKCEKKTTKKLNPTLDIQQFVSLNVG